MEFITVTINNRPTFVRPHATVLQACEAAGVEVPRFCYHEKLSVSGNCRRCLVEIQKTPKPVAACARPVAKGRVVFTNTPLVRKAREAVLEFLLLNHPLDCPICDQGGECDLQDEAFTYGSDRGRNFEFKRSVEDKECGPVIKTIRTRCIHCTRCVRFSAEVAGYETRGAFGRGEDREIGTYVHSFIRTELSGNLVDLCPVGALTSKPYAYQSRSWELQRIDTLDFFDAVCSDISVHTRQRTITRIKNNKYAFFPQEDIVRVLPRTNGFYSENWISDRTRYAFDGLKNSRLTTPVARSNKGVVSSQTWEQFINNYDLSFLGFSASNYKKVVPRHFVAGPQTNLERVYALSTFAKIRGNNSIQQGNYISHVQVDAPFFYSFNRTVQNVRDGFSSGYILVGTNLRYEASLINTRLRREQNRRQLTYTSIGAFSPFRYSQNHQGNSVRTLISFLENRLSTVQSRVQNVLPLSILLGVESLRVSSGYSLQRLVSFLGKRLYTKTNSFDRLGYIHSSIGSLAFAHLGLKTKTLNSNFVKAKDLIVYNIHQPNFKFKKTVKSKFGSVWNISFDTHNSITQGQLNHQLPITSLYEREGHVINIENRLRKLNKVVATTGSERSLESIFSILCRVQGEYKWFKWTEGLSRYLDEVPANIFLDTTICNFKLNPFVFEVTKGNSFSIKLFTFYQTVRNFYLQEPIAEYSSVRGECSLFIGKEGNFVAEA